MQARWKMYLNVSALRSSSSVNTLRGVCNVISRLNSPPNRPNVSAVYKPKYARLLAGRKQDGHGKYGNRTKTSAPATIHNVSRVSGNGLPQPGLDFLAQTVTAQQCRDLLLDSVSIIPCRRWLF